LKALIEDRKLNPPKSHDLLMLYGKVDDAIDLDEDTLATLNQVYIDSRYPASLGSLPEGLPDVEDAKGFFEFAGDVLSQVKTILQTQ
jgi:HEPN domain-containing protein